MSWPTAYDPHNTMHTRLHPTSFYIPSTQSNPKCRCHGINQTSCPFTCTTSGTNSSNSHSTREHRDALTSARSYTHYKHTHNDSHSSFPIPTDLLPVIATRFINSILNTSSTSLIDLIKHVTHRVQLTPYTIVGSLLLLQKLKAMYHNLENLPLLYSPKRLFMSSVMAAFKANMEDIHYLNKTWAQATGGAFDTLDLNQMEREFCRYLNWEFQMTTSMILTFAEMLMRDFSHEGPYPTYQVDLLQHWKGASSKKKEAKKSGESSHRPGEGSNHSSMKATSSRGSNYAMGYHPWFR